MKVSAKSVLVVLSITQFFILIILLFKYKENRNDPLKISIEDQSKRNPNRLRKSNSVSGSRNRVQKPRVDIDWPDDENGIHKLTIVDELPFKLLAGIKNKMRPGGRGKETRREMSSMSEARDRLIHEYGKPWSISHLPNVIHEGEDSYFFSAPGSDDFSLGYAVAKKDGAFSKWDKD